METRPHEAEQASHVRAVMAHLDALMLERDAPATTKAREQVVCAAVELLAVVYSAPFRYADWTALDDLVAPVVDGFGIVAARKAGRDLADKGVLSIKGAAKGPAWTRCKLASMPPYPIQ